MLVSDDTPAFSTFRGRVWPGLASRFSRRASLSCSCSGGVELEGAGFGATPRVVKLFERFASSKKAPAVKRKARVAPKNHSKIPLKMTLR